MNMKIYPITLFSYNIISAFRYSPSLPIEPSKPHKPVEPKKPEDFSKLFYFLVLVFFFIFIISFLKFTTNPFLQGAIGIVGILFFIVKGTKNDKEVNEYPRNVFKYREDIVRYSENINKYNTELEEYNKLKIKYSNEDFIDTLKFDRYYNSIKDFKKPQIYSSKDSTYITGKSEYDFFILLKEAFNENIDNNLYFQFRDSEYKPDYVYYDDSIIIDIEVDEPYELGNGIPIHFIGSDDYRNECFLKSGWNIIRFSEEQIVKEPTKCIEFLKLFIRIIKDRKIDIASELLDNFSINRVEQWTKDEAHQMAYRKYRSIYSA